MSKLSSVRVPAMRWRNVFEISTTVVMIALASALVWQGRVRSSHSPPASSRSVVAVPRDPIGIIGGPALGATTARVALVEYSDFQCPFCGVVARDTMPTVIREYVDTGKVMLIFKHLPLAIHPLAPGAAAAALCAGQQGRFWQMHDRLFAEPVRLADQDLRASASEVGLDLAIYDQCRTQALSRKLIEADRIQAEALQITATPTFIFGRVEPDGRVRATDVLTGAKPIANFKAILDRLLE